MCLDAEKNRDQNSMTLYRSQLNDQACASARDLDNVITLVATGALVISIGLLDYFSSIFEIFIVGTSWAFLLVTLVVHVISHWFSIKAFERQVDLLDEDNLENGKNPWTPRVTFLNILARISLVVGIALLATYAFSNLQVSSEKTDGQVNCICNDKLISKEMGMNDKVTTGVRPPKPPTDSSKKKGGITPPKPPPKPKPATK